MSPGIPTELQREEEELEPFNKVANELLRIARCAMKCGDRTNAIRALTQVIRVEQIKRQSGGNLARQQARMGNSHVGLTTGKPPLTDEEKKYVEQIECLSPADRMLLRDIYTAMNRISELEAQAKSQGTMSDLLREQPKKEEPKGEESTTSVPVIAKEEDGRQHE